MKHLTEVPKDWHEGLEEFMEMAPDMSRTFEPGSDLHPPFYDEDGKPYWRGYWRRIRPETDRRDLEEYFCNTDIALRWVKMVIRLRQEELDDKKLFAQDPVLQEVRRHALRLGSYRIHINMALLQVEREEQAMARLGRMLGRLDGLLGMVAGESLRKIIDSPVYGMPTMGIIREMDRRPTGGDITGAERAMREQNGNTTQGSGHTKPIKQPKRNYHAEMLEVFAAKAHLRNKEKP